MSGNVWEWCWDRIYGDITTGTPSTGAASGSNRVNRGGSWNFYDTDGSCTVSSRSCDCPEDGATASARASAAATVFVSLVPGLNKKKLLTV